MFTTRGVPVSAASRTAGPAPRHGSVTSGNPPDAGVVPDTGQCARSAFGTSSLCLGLGDDENDGCGVGEPPEPLQPTTASMTAAIARSAALTASPRSGSVT